MTAAEEMDGLKNWVAGVVAPWRKGVERERDLNWRIGGEVNSIFVQFGMEMELLREGDDDGGEFCEARG